MKHARTDYNRIQDPAVLDPAWLSPGSSAIGEDEPVFLLRAQDRSAAETVRFWADENVRNDGDVQASKLAERWADVMEAWPNRKPADLGGNGRAAAIESTELEMRVLGRLRKLRVLTILDRVDDVTLDCAVRALSESLPPTRDKNGETASERIARKAGTP